MLISKGMQRIIRILLNNRGKRLTTRRIAKEAALSLGIASKILNQLASTGYYKKGEACNWERLLSAWAHTTSIKEVPTIEFTAAERPQYVMRKIAKLIPGFNYAFTLYSATELVAPYVTPGKTHLYIDEKQKSELGKIFTNHHILPAEKGNLVCYPVDQSYLYNRQKIKNMFVVSLPQLYVDLFSIKGRGAEAAGKVLEVMKNV